jgi:hypothetical protein
MDSKITTMYWWRRASVIPLNGQMKIESG